MPYALRRARRRAVRLYDWLLAREEEAHQQPGYTLPWTLEQPSYDGTPQRLAALQRGEPVDLPVSALPAWARVGEKLHWWRRATVSADSVTFYDDDGSEWLTENGL